MITSGHAQHDGEDRDPRHIAAKIFDARLHKEAAALEGEVHVLQHRREGHQAWHRSTPHPRLRQSVPPFDFQGWAHSIWAEGQNSEDLRQWSASVTDRRGIPSYAPGSLRSQMGWGPDPLFATCFPTSFTSMAWQRIHSYTMSHSTTLTCLRSPTFERHGADHWGLQNGGRGPPKHPPSTHWSQNCMEILSPVLRHELGIWREIDWSSRLWLLPLSASWSQSCEEHYRTWGDHKGHGW